MIRVGIVGGTGYVAGELIRCLVHHPEVEMAFVYSHSQPGVPVASVHQDLFMHPEWAFTSTLDLQADVVFLCMGHGQSQPFLERTAFASHTRIIDLSQDFRLAEKGEEFVYGLPEYQAEAIAQSQKVANPGCFATAIQLAFLPLARAGLLTHDVHVHALTGSTGAGQSLSATSHFSWRNNNVSVYKPFEHQHLGEIGQTLHQLQPDFAHDLYFVPMRGNFTRGILATLYTPSTLSEEEVVACYQSYYASAPFVHLSHETVHLKQVVNTNHALLHVQRIKGQVLVTSVIDNLLKGAAGQAIQNMNLMMGLPETTGLDFKPSYF